MKSLINDVPYRERGSRRGLLYRVFSCASYAVYIERIFFEVKIQPTPRVLYYEVTVVSYQS